MGIEITEFGEWTVIVPRDRCFDVHLVPDFKKVLADLVRTGRHRVAIDLSEVVYVDTAGLGAMVFALRSVESHGDFALTGVNDQFRTLLDMTGLDQVFRIVASAEELREPAHGPS